MNAYHQYRVALCLAECMCLYWLYDSVQVIIRKSAYSDLFPVYIPEQVTYLSNLMY